MTLVDLLSDCDELNAIVDKAVYERDKAARLVARAAVAFFEQAAMENLRRLTLRYAEAEKAYGLALNAAVEAADAVEQFHNEVAS